MYAHHQRAIQCLKEYFAGQPGVLGVILGGSVAKGLERPDSDIDAMVVVTDARYKELQSQNLLSEVISGYCDYEGGYFDIKYMTKEYLLAAAQKGSEPTRNPFIKSRCILAPDPEIPSIVERIPVFQKQEKEDKMLSFYAALCLNRGYFWHYIDDPILRARVVSDIAFFGLRLLLEDQEVLFPCAKSLMKAVERLPHKPQDILEKCRIFVENPCDETKDAFVDPILECISYRPPEDYNQVLSRYVEDNEQWWYSSRPLIAEW
jgi:predicted nucleotidyltransferase